MGNAGTYLRLLVCETSHADGYFTKVRFDKPWWYKRRKVDIGSRSTSAELTDTFPRSTNTVPRIGTWLYATLTRWR